MNLTKKQLRVIDQVISAFETGKLCDYGSVTILKDGPNHTPQITYAKHQTTEASHLKKLLTLYVQANGTYSTQLAPYLNWIGQVPSLLTKDQNFIQLLKNAGTDPVMQQVQDDFFGQQYMAPAQQWAQNNGFTLALSMLVIYDSFIQSGSIVTAIRNAFAEKTPNNGGNEKMWITSYVVERNKWLANHSNPVVHPTVYRTKCMLGEINRDNWDLIQLPINANGVKVL